LDALAIAPHAQKRILHGILGVVQRARHAIAVDQELATVAGRETVEGLLVTSANRSGQRGCLG
jgi:hypothetical protein